jgi:hypothetical protein
VNTGPLSILHFVLTEYVRAARGEQARREEATVQRLLQCWASEFEPCVILRQGTYEVVGLGVDGDPTGTVVVAAAALKETP